LDPREELTTDDRGDDGVVWLRYPPAMMLFKLFHYEFDPFPGFQPGEIPVFPSEKTFTINDHHNPSLQIWRRQYPLTAAYAFMDQKAQGQTIGHALVDIGTTARFPVTPFAVYVALSQSCGRNTIWLLRDFDETIFTKHPSEALWIEDGRLRGLDADTKNKYETGYFDFK
jgi:hypothetical protein